MNVITGHKGHVGHKGHDNGAEENVAMEGTAAT